MFILGVNLQYTSTHSAIAAAFARTSFGADRHRIVGFAAFGYVKNDYRDYLGTGSPEDERQPEGCRWPLSLPARSDWFVGAQGNAANYQVLGESTEDDFVLETLGVRGFKPAALGAVVMHDSRDDEDMPRRGWYLNMNNLAYREALGGADSFDAYRADIRAF